MPWLRLWTDILDDVDIHALPLNMVGAWTLLLTAAKKFNRDGELPPAKTLAFWVHRSVEDVQGWINALVTAGFIDSNGVTYRMHGWERWQEPKDATNAARQARWKAGKKDHPDSQVTPLPPPPAPPNTELIQDTDTEGAVTHLPLPPLPGNGSNGSITPLPASVCVEDLPTKGKAEWDGIAESWVRSGDESPLPEPPPARKQPAPSTDPEVKRVADLAAEIAGDIGWATWVCSRVKLGDKPLWIEAAIGEAVNSNILTPKYVASILARYAAEGGPRKVTMSIVGGKSSPATNQPPVIPMNHPPMPGHMSRAEYEAQRARAR